MEQAVPTARLTPLAIGNFPVNCANPSRPAGAGLRRNILRPAARAHVRGRAVSAAGGFTLTEILIAIVLMLIIGGLAAANFSHLADSVGHLPPEKVLQSVIREARFLAMQRRSPVVLTYNTDTRSFNLLDNQGNILEQTPDGVDDPESKLTLTFTAVLPQKDATSDPNPQDEDSIEYSKQPPEPSLFFDPSGVTKPVKVTLTQDQNKPIEYRLDPFSEGPPPKTPENVPPVPTS